MLKLSKNYSKFIIFIIFIKLVFLIFLLIEKYYSYQLYHNPSAIKQKYDSENYNWAIYWKERLELIFIILMAFVCIIVFYPNYSDTIFIDKETRLLLFIYGFIILLTANWNILFQLPPWLTDIKPQNSQNSQNSSN
jgi:hypothetical protein